MDYNNIKERLDRTLKSLNTRFDENVADNILFNAFNPIVGKELFVSFGKNDLDSMINKIFLILYNLASFKDHLKNCFKNKTLNPQIIEDEVNNSFHLQVLFDIVNQEKHGTPLRNNRSGKNPVIKNLIQGLELSSNASINVKISPSAKVEITGDHRIRIDSEIWDDNNNLLFDLDELINESYDKWVQIIKLYGCGI